jgi:hypothetical protein
VCLSHTCPNRAVFNPNCPACVAGARALAGADDPLTVPPAMATPETFGCTGREWCDCPFCPAGEVSPTAAPAPMPLPTEARLYRMVTTRRTGYVWATSPTHAKLIFLGDRVPLGVPSAPCPADRPGDDLWHDEPTVEWLAWFTRYRPLLWHRLDLSTGECLLRVDGPYPG